MKKVLVTGGAGYKGVLLVEGLLNAGCEVTILDNFMYGYEPVLPFAAREHCSIVKKDIRNIKESDVSGYDIIYHLAAISGYPACEANPHSAQTINVYSTENLVNFLGHDQILVYASTTSMYGRSGQEQDENSRPMPVSTYGVTKYKAEINCMQRRNSIALRFATLFGVSPKMRVDLLVNDFTYKAYNERSLVLFDAGSVRTFLHVRDAIRAYLMVLDRADEMLGQVYNVGADNMNFSKKDIACKIKEQRNTEIIETSLEDPDQRNFIIQFEKIKALGFAPTISLEDGIREMLSLYSWYKPDAPFRTI